jgi:hypothetical protein
VDVALGRVAEKPSKAAASAPASTVRLKLPCFCFIATGVPEADGTVSPIRSIGGGRFAQRRD